MEGLKSRFVGETFSGGRNQRVTLHTPLSNLGLGFDWPRSVNQNITQNLGKGSGEEPFLKGFPQRRFPPQKA